jgi:hypothetical protein
MSRLDQARRRAGAAKHALAAASAVGFVVALLLARSAHPGHAAHVQTSSSSSVTVVPQVTTHVS